jgi:hypothetical protein
VGKRRLKRLGFAYFIIDGRLRNPRPRVFALQPDQASLFVFAIDVDTVLALTLSAVRGKVRTVPSILGGGAHDCFKFVPRLRGRHEGIGVRRHGALSDAQHASANISSLWLRSLDRSTPNGGNQPILLKKPWRNNFGAIIEVSNVQQGDDC